MSRNYSPSHSTLRTQLGELSHTLLQSRARFHCKTLTGVLEFGRLGSCSPHFPYLDACGGPGAKLVCIAFLGEMVKPASRAPQRAQRYTEERMLITNGIAGVQNEAVITHGCASTTRILSQGYIPCRTIIAAPSAHRIRAHNSTLSASPHRMPTANRLSFSGRSSFIDKSSPARSCAR